MTENDKNTPPDSAADAMLDQLFAEAGALAPEPSPDLMARVLDDALSQRPAPRGAVAAPKGWLAGLLSGIGGIPGAGGLVTAGIVGLWIGVSPPETLEINASGLWDIFGTDLTSSWASYGDIL